MKLDVRKQQQGGYITVGVLILLGVAAIVMASNLNISTSNAFAVRATKMRAVEFYDAEESLNKALTWLRVNSTGLTSVFSRSDFYTKFDRTVPSVGSNDTGDFKYPTKIKLQGSQNSAIPSNSSLLASGVFPATVDTVTNAAFNPQSIFPSASLGNDLIRITLVDAVPVDPTKDYGDPDLGNPPPATDFNPIYRIDSMRAQDRGGHIYAYVVGALVFDYGVGFFGRDQFEMRQTCDSYLSNAGSYSSASRRPNCTTGSEGPLQIHQAEILFGTARTKGVISGGTPWGGLVCATFQAGCPVRGLTCQGTGCSVPALPTYNAWATYCPTEQADVSYSSATTLSVPGNSSNQRCWNKVTVGNNTTVTLNTTTYSYFIEELSIANNGQVKFAPNPANGTINLYVKKFTGDSFNGNQVFNSSTKPYQLRIHYLGTDDLTLNGTAAMSAFMVAPYASVTVSGNFSYFGGIKAKELHLTGSGDVHYDESGEIATLSDVQYKARNVVARYR